MSRRIAVWWGFAAGTLGAGAVAWTGWTEHGARAVAWLAVRRVSRAQRDAALSRQEPAEAGSHEPVEPDAERSVLLKVKPRF